MSEENSSCEYRKRCHFNNIPQMTPANKRFKEIYCIEWPQKCAIHQVMATGKPVSITLWPTGKLSV